MDNVYIVLKVSTFDESIEEIVGVCSTPELADHMASELEKEYNSEDVLDFDIISQASDEVRDIWDDPLKESEYMFDYLKGLYPECPEDKIERSVNRYYFGFADVEFIVKEVPFYNN